MPVRGESTEGSGTPLSIVFSAMDQALFGA
jgi:hypothetical protein